MAVSPSTHAKQKTKRHSRPFKELISKLGQSTKPTTPKYADSTKKSYENAWIRWILFCQQVYEESSYFPTPDPVKICENHLSYEVVRSFLEWSFHHGSLLIDEFELRETGRFRAVMNADDVLDILHHHWVLSDEYYPEERQRVQHAALNLFCASTTSRAGTIVESTGYLEQNEAVEYRDI
ncbi:hypothetical protein EPUS_09513 [Endocarpon pusillum Z07020]|uniref:Uncharacterized protein n=1 Tax=Endocarpon pusillum (strain Z07020 / HMAS-L-300199) TaxID=1263415 RepID=U1HG09_ENDPU|nr:uncharacterized protein EPUS_09513 [Endocarpon pusillum Z07020]ERF69055.1 hypothetical protein EPUS_09513 [Endocarpon pusillum Z07020]